MATPNLTDANIEYVFADEESVAARILDPLKIQWLQTKYAQAWKQKASMMCPEKIEDDRSFLLKMAELDGRLNLIQELFNDHQEALKAYNTARLSENKLSSEGSSDVSVIAHSAAQQVHQT